MSRSVKMKDLPSMLGDNQDEKAASIKVRTGWCWRVAGRA
jgi:hypothetical protein